MTVVRFQHPTLAQIAFGMFVRAGVMSCLQGAGVVFLAKHSSWALLTSFLISYHWVAAARGSADHRHPAIRFAYGLGGLSGTGVVLLVAWWLS